MRRFRVRGLVVAALTITSALVAPVAPVASAADPPPSALGLNALSALGKDVFAQLSRPASLGTKLSYTGVDPQARVVEIGVVGYTPALARSLEQRFGADRVRVVPAQTYRTAVLKFRKTDSRLRSPRPGSGIGVQDTVGNCGDGVFCSPTRGGVYMEQDQGNGWYYACTSTIVGTSRHGQNATLTAGHCFPSRNRPIVYGTHQFGSIPVAAVLGYPGDTQFAGSSDHMVIPWQGSAGATGFDYLNNCVFVPGVNCNRMNFNASTSDLSNHPEVTQRGDTTGRTIGRVEIVSGTVQIRDGSSIITLTDMVQTSACSLPGDSGGVAFIRDRVVGTISAGNFLQDPGQPPRCNPTPRSWISKSTNAYSNIGFSSRLTP